MPDAMNQFSQSAGTFLTVIGQSYKAYAGHGDGKNNPAMEGVRGVGPLPRGKYRASEMFENHPHVGQFALHLTPDDETRARIVALGRDPDSFFCHGDSREHPGEASDGCIILPVNVRLFVWEHAPWIEVTE